MSLSATHTWISVWQDHALEQLPPVQLFPCAVNDLLQPTGLRCPQLCCLQADLVPCPAAMAEPPLLHPASPASTPTDAHAHTPAQVSVNMHARVALQEESANQFC